MLNDIPVRQETPEAHRRLAAQKYLYARAKWWAGLSLILGVPITTTVSLSQEVFQDYKAYGALAALLIAIINLLVLDRRQRTLREEAAKIQELFDCDVLSLEWHKLKVGNKPDPDLVLEYAQKMARIKGGLDNIPNWYAPISGQLNLPLARLACQRTNFWWNSRLRRRWVIGVTWVLVILSILIVLFALYKQQTLADFLVFLSPLLPAFAWGIPEIDNQNRAIIRLDQLKEHTQELWDEALGGKLKPVELTHESRDLQDEIFDNRKTQPTIPELLYNIFRKKDEEQMVKNIEAYVAEAFKRQATP